MTTCASTSTTTTNNLLTDAWDKAFGDLTDDEIENIATDLLAQLPPAAGEAKAKAKAKRRKRVRSNDKKKRSRTIASQPIPTLVTTHALPPPNFAVPRPITRKPKQRKLDFPQLPPPPAPTTSLLPAAPLPLPPLPTSAPPFSFESVTSLTPELIATLPIESFPPLSVDEALDYVLDSFDSLLAPLIPPPSVLTPACMPLRRALYRRQFSTEAVKLIHHNQPITSLDSLIPIIQASCAKCNILLI